MTRWLLRFDDVCPTMDWQRWNFVEPLLDAAGAQPMLAIVPDNRDPMLKRNPPNPLFWERARAWQKKGWIIAQHGYQHVYDTARPGLVPWWSRSEFAGHPKAEQEHRLREGFRLMAVEGLMPVAFSAPGHSFDDTTLDVVLTMGIRVVSDGVNFRPYRDGRGLIWIPVQPWTGGLPPCFVGTICIHLNTHPAPGALERLLRERGRSIVGRAFPFEKILETAAPRDAVDTFYERAYWPVFHARQRLAGAVKALLERDSDVAAGA